MLDRAPDRSVLEASRAAPGKNRRCAPTRLHPAGFSLLELVIVLAVTLILTSLMLPALTGVRKNVYKVISSSHLRQLGLGITMYARDYPDRLPYSDLLRQGLPMELMAAHIGDGRPEAWDGIGLLFFLGYCDTPEIFYCPGHPGEHTYEIYQFFWKKDFAGDQRIYTNYHYCGDVEWEDLGKRRSLDQGDKLVLVTDSFRTRADLNHKTGMNILRADGSVRWHEFNNQFYALIPSDLEGDQTEYNTLWDELQKLPR